MASLPFLQRHGRGWLMSLTRRLNAALTTVSHCFIQDITAMIPEITGPLLVP